MARYTRFTFLVSREERVLLHEVAKFLNKPISAFVREATFKEVENIINNINKQQEVENEKSE